MHKERCAQAWPQDRWRETPGEVARFPQLEPSEHSGPRSLHTTWQHWIRGQDLGKESTGAASGWEDGGHCWPLLKQCFRGRSLAVGYSSIVVHYPAINDERPHRPHSLIHIVIPKQGEGLWMLQVVIGCEQQKGLEPKAVIEHNHRGLHRHLCLWPILRL